MKLRIVWHPAALTQLYDLAWSAAASIDAAVIRVAEAGRGDVEWVPPYYRLRIGSTVCGSPSTATPAR